MANPKSYIGVIKHYQDKDKTIREYYEYLPSLIDDDYPFDVALSYLFARLELAQNMTIYCGIRKQHRTDVDLTDIAVENWDTTKETFESKFELVFGKPIPTTILAQRKDAQKARNNVMHGKSVDEASKRKAIADVLDYSESLNKFVQAQADFEPFGKLTGITGAASALDASTSRFVLRGMGFSM
jgi:hypothetical protein